MSHASRTFGAERWSLIALLFGTAIACSSSSVSSSTNVPDGSTATGGSAGNGASGGAGGSFSSGGAAGTGGFEVCLSCGGAFGAGGRSGSGGSTGGAGAGGVPAFCATPTTEWLPPMKTCQSDADCKVVPTFSCCGPGTIYGVATTSVPRFSQCFMTSPPQGCPLLGCASQARTEDNQSYQPANYGDLSGVEARCVDTGGGTKECTSTLRGSCIHNVTRCTAGIVCQNPCGANCTCQDGYANCLRPMGACPARSAVCEYPATPSSQTFTSCTCPYPGGLWSCSP